MTAAESLQKIRSLFMLPNKAYGDAWDELTRLALLGEAAQNDPEWTQKSLHEAYALIDGFRAECQNNVLDIDQWMREQGRP